MKVRDVMTQDVVTVQPGATLKHAAELLVEHRISGFLLVDVDGRVLGILSERDLLFKAQGELRRNDWLRWLVDPLAVTDRRKLMAHLVGQAMTSPVETIDANQPVSWAAQVMLGADVKRLPVIEHGKLVGIVTRADLIRALARPDAEIAADIRELVVKQLLVDPRSLEIQVTDGEVTLSGPIATPPDAEVLPKLVARVPGVVGVRSGLVAPNGIR
jgi:CBS domain-containing protein